MCKLQKPLILWFRSLLILAFHSHQSAAAVNVFQREFMSTSMPLSFCLLLEPLENSPPMVLGNALHQSHTNERHYTLQSVWFKDDLQSFSSAEGNETLPRDKLRIHLQYSKDIKGLKLCIGFIGGVRTTRKGFYQMWNFHNRVRGMWVIVIPESIAAFMICSRACTHCMCRCSEVVSLMWCLYKHHFCLYIQTDMPNVLALEQITSLHFCSAYTFPLRCNA